MSHAKAAELQAAALAAPYVAKYGDLIAGQKNHESTGLTTLPFAAPVIINGDTVNVGVAIQFQKNGKPRAVNVEYQSGEKFVIDTKKVPAGLDSRVERYVQGTSLPTTGTNKSIRNDSGKVNMSDGESASNIGEFDRENKDIRFSFDDEDYLMAVRAGDLDGAQGMVDEAAEKLEKDGVRVRYFKGTLMSETHDGRMRRTSGLFRAGTNEVWASVSSARFSPEQIAMHEYYHALVYRGVANVEQTVQEIREKFSTEEFDQIVEQYLKDYRGAYEGDKTEDIYEELLADAYAGMNRFAKEKSAVQYQDVVRDQIQRGTSENERATRDTRGAPESRFSFGRGIKLGRQEYRNLQSARMTKYTTYGKMMSDVDWIFANDMFYIIKNHELDSFDAIKKIDPAKDNEIIEEIMEGIEDGSQNENEVYSKVIEVLQSEQRDSVRGRGNNAKRRSGRQDAGLVHGTEDRTNRGGNKEGSDSNRDRDGRIDKLSFDDEDYMLAVEAGDMDAA